jgi:hypothetical protein
MSAPTERDLLAMIMRRRQLSGENYEKARKNILEYLKSSGRITSEEYERLKNAHGPRS